MLCARRTCLLLALLSLQLLVACASGLTLARDPQRRFYRYTPRKDADTAGSVQWEPLRLADGRLVRDSDSARSFQRRYTFATPQERRTLLGRAILNEASPHGTAAMDAYYHGTSLVRRGEPRAAREAFATARSLDTTLSYVSDLDLWDAWASRSLGLPDSAATSYQRFLDQSEGLCPASAEQPECDNAARYGKLLDSLGAFAIVVADTSYFANRREHAPNLQREAYGIAPRRKVMDMGLVLSSEGGLGLLGTVRLPVRERLEPEVLGLFSAGMNLAGGGMRTSLVSDPDNRYGIKLLTFGYEVWTQDDGHSFSFPQALVGIEGSWAPKRDWLFFASAGKFYHDQSNRARFVRDTLAYTIWFDDYIDVGTTWYWSKAAGLTLKEHLGGIEAGWQYGSLFLGWDFRRNYLCMSFQGISELL